MCSDPRLNKSDDFRKGLEEYLRKNMTGQFQQTEKIQRYTRWEIFIERIKRFIKGKRGNQ